VRTPSPSEIVRPKVVQERLGHSQVSVTLDTFSQVAPSLQREAAGRRELNHDPGVPTSGCGSVYWIKTRMV
jgi:hypothetical protein